MKNILFFLICLIAVSCTTQKVLKTDTSQDIDLSGRWNNTDAEIATNELFNSLITSSWFKKKLAGNDLKTRIKVLEFNGNFKDGGEQLEMYFKRYAKTDSSIELIEKDSEIIPEYLLVGEITAEEFISESDNYIDYTVIAELTNSDGIIQWQDKTIIKKYLKD